MRGRRRVGKSRLVETFVERTGTAHIYFTASRQLRTELELFAEAVIESSLPNADIFGGTKLENWDAALRLLNSVLPSDAPSIVVIDEFPYLLEQDRGIEATFQKQWDRLLSRKPVLLILVGSDIAIMEALNTYDRAFYQRGTEMVIPPLSPVETAAIVGSPDAASAFDSFLITGGLPLICDEWSAGLSTWEYVTEAISDSTSALIVSAERTLAAEFPVEAMARDVLGKIGSGETTFTNIARAAGGINSASVSRALEILVAKRIVTRETPLSTKASKEARYRITDPYMSFWLTFVGPNLSEIERGRGDRVIERIKATWPSWRGRVIEPIVREAISRLLPIEGLTGDVVGGYWTRTNIPEVDIIGADRSPVADSIAFSGSIKWHDNDVFSQGELNALATATVQVPGASENTPLVAVSRTGFAPNLGAHCKLGPTELLSAW